MINKSRGSQQAGLDAAIAKMGLAVLFSDQRSTDYHPGCIKIGIWRKEQPPEACQVMDTLQALL